MILIMTSFLMKPLYVTICEYFEGRNCLTFFWLNQVAKCLAHKKHLSHSSIHQHLVPALSVPWWRPENPLTLHYQGSTLKYDLYETEENVILQKSRAVLECRHCSLELRATPQVEPHKNLGEKKKNLGELLGGLVVKDSALWPLWPDFNPWLGNWGLEAKKNELLPVSLCPPPPNSSLRTHIRFWPVYKYLSWLT